MHGDLPTPRRYSYWRVLVLVVIWFQSLGSGRAGDATGDSSQEELQVSTDGSTSTVASSTGGTTTTTPPVAPVILDCGIWIAPSSLPNTGLGMYAGHDFEYGAELLSDIAIPIIDLRFHLRDPDFGYLWDSYVWNGEGIDMERDGYADINYASPGFGSVANSFLPLHNVQQWDPDWVASRTDLHRSRDPGAGAVTPYGNRRSTALRDIRAGEELFVSYGEDWFIDREYLGLVPLTDDLNQATKLVRAFLQRRNSSTVTTNNDNDDADADATAAVWDDAWQSFVASVPAIGASSRVLGAFNHSDPSEWEQLTAGSKTLTELRIEQSHRDDAWLRDHGVCGDHLVVGPSTIPQAGLGALARRNLPRGTLVASLPLVHIPDRSVLTMYSVDFDPETGKPEPHPERGSVGEQILLNYCLGHHDSTLLLCSYGPQASYINHNQTKANVMLQWGDPERGNHQPSYLDMPLEQLIEVKSSKLSLHLVAIRDIREGDEVFLDYGDEWEAAWQKHVREWHPMPDAASYRDARTLNGDPETEPLPTEPEHLLPKDRRSVATQHPNVELWCSEAYMSERWKEFYPDRLEELNAQFSYRCDILRRTVDDDTGRYRYTAVLWTDEERGDDEDDDDDDAREKVAARTVGKLVDVPRHAFQYRDRPYTTDMFLRNAFRHDIRIPDHLFPEVWKNRAYLERQGVDAFFH